MKVQCGRGCFLASIGAALISLCGVSHATIIDRDLFTTDSESGLDWLDLTETRGQSYDAIVSQMGAGQQYEGWRHASRDEVMTFWQDAGGIGPFTGAALGNANWVGELQRLWGVTYPYPYAHPHGYLLQTSIAMTNEPSPSCPACNVTVYLASNLNISDSNEGDLAEALQINENYRWNAQIPIGHALIRNSESETRDISAPPPLALLAISLPVLGLIRRGGGQPRSRRVSVRTPRD